MSEMLEPKLPELYYPRRRTRPVAVGGVIIGGGAPVAVQSMITEETRNVAGCVAQIIGMADAGCEIVRVTTPTLAEAHCLARSRRKCGGVATPFLWWLTYIIRAATSPSPSRSS